MTTANKCHFIGIGGIGMSGLARLLLGRSIEVSGSDMADNYVTEGLKKAGATVFIGHSSKHIAPGATVVYSSDIKQDNPEYQAALSMKCELLHRSDMLVRLMEGYKTLAVAGTHGKTTTSALLSSVLLKAGMDPSFAVGGVLKQFECNAGHGSGPYFVAEADESDGTFLKYSPFGAIVTNIDLDHMNYFGTEHVLIEAFQTFMKKVKSADHLFWCGEDPRLVALALPGLSYGFASHCALKATDVQEKGWGMTFDITFQGHTYKDVTIQLTGRHNVLNALAVFGLARSVGADEASIREALSTFQGVGRRCERKGESHGVLVLDDYAHHPTEIRATLYGIRNAIQDRRLIAVYQPHRYSRTKDCLGTFGGIFDDADEVFVTDIFAAGESPIGAVSHADVMKELPSKTRYAPRNKLVEAIATSVRPHDVVVTLGAGDITKVGPELLQTLQKAPPKKFKVALLFGGRSLEHEVSVVSAKNIAASLNPDYYECEYFGIGKDGAWHPGIKPAKEMTVVSEGKPGKGLSPEALTQILGCEVCFPVLHGPFGEDGTIQGFFEMLGKAYVGCGHTASATAMDKAATKRMMIFNGIATSPFISFSKHDWRSNPAHLKAQIFEQLRFPLFVKPVHLGSAIGVNKVETPQELDAAIAAAFEVDNVILVENGIDGREIEFAVMGNDWVTVFPPGEVLTGGKVYDYDMKYGPGGFGTTNYAEMPQEVREEGMYLAEWAYKAIGCQGMARVDFFLDKQNKFWLNEINPIPGFTGISLYPQICNANGLSTPALLDKLIVMGLERRRHQK